MENLIFISIGILLGIYSSKIYAELISKKKKKVYKKDSGLPYSKRDSANFSSMESIEIFTEIVRNLINNTVYFKIKKGSIIHLSTKLEKYDYVDIICDNVKSEISIFKNDKFLFNSEDIDKISISIIINHINRNLTLGKMTESIIKEKISKLLETDHNIKKNEQKIKIKLELDDILDRINEIGYDNLTKEEKDFLNNQK